MTTPTELIQRLSGEADLCRNDGATDVAKLLDDAVYALVNQAAEIASLRADAGRLRAVADAASVYYQHYMQDEAESPEDCVCGNEQHQHAVAVRDSLAALRQEHPT